MNRNPHAGEPFTDPDGTIAAALEDCSVPALMCSLVHMTGDPAWIRGDIRPRVAVSLDIQSGLPADERAEIRRRALPSIAAYRDAGCAPHELSRELLLEMMSFLGCMPLDDGRLAGMMFDDLQFEGGDTGAIVWGEEIPEEVKAASPVLVIGCGMAGILAGIRLKQAGLPFTIVDKNPGPGGTWWENRYPGARVDIGSHQYCLLLRALRSLERVLLPAAGAPGVFLRHRRQVRTATALSVRHQCHQAALGRRALRVANPARRRGRAGGNHPNPDSSSARSVL